MSKLHIANTFFEWELETQSNMSLREAFSQHPIFLQLQFLPVVYAEPDDALLVSDLPDPEYGSSFRHFTLEDKAILSEEIESWGPSLLIAAWAKARRLKYSIPEWAVVKEVNSKRFSFENSPKLPGSVLLEEEGQTQQWIHSNQGAKVLKTCFGVSGKGHLLIDQGTDWDRIRRFLHEEWKKELPVIAEPWVNRILDFSTQWYIEGGKITYLGSTICKNDKRGQYQYNEVGPEKELFSEHYPSLLEHQQKVQPLLKTIANKGFFGNLGIDAMLYTLEDPDKTLLQPIVEINARKTMGWAALMFQKLYHPKDKIRFSYTAADKGYLPKSLVLKNGKRVSFQRNLV